MAATGAKKIDDYNKKMWESAQKSALYFSGQQKSNNTCALMAVNSVLWEATGSNDPKPTNLFTMAGFPILEYFEIGIFGNLATDTPRNEREMVRIGIASLGYSRLGGTTNIAKVMNAVGIPATQIWDPTLTDIAKKVEDGHGVVVGYDTRPVWHDESNPDPEGHAVRVTGVERGANGEIAAFYINDSGIDKNGGAKRVSAANFKDALDGLGGGVMAVTDAPISTIDPVRL